MSALFNGAERAARAFLASNPQLGLALPGFRDAGGLVEPAEVLALVEQTGLPRDRALLVLMSVVAELMRREVSS